MKKKYKLPTLLGIFVLILGLVAGVVLINSRQEFRLGANTEAIPKNVRITNVTDTSLTVTWTTDIESQGFIKWGKSSGLLSKVALEENAEKSLVHSVNIVGVEPNSNIFFKINSNSKDYDNNGTVWKTITSENPVSSANLISASGIVLTQNNSTPTKALVYLTINGNIISGITSNEGSYFIPISQYVSLLPTNGLIEMSINAGSLGTATATILAENLRNIPVIVLGKSYDFRTIELPDDKNLPESLLILPEQLEKSSRFEISKSGSSSTDPTSVQIESIDEGEIINTFNPEFFGNGPKNSSIEIVVESEMQSAVISTNSNGKWNWSPPNNLEPGEHKLTVKWRDASGIVRSITRTFLVQASEGPAFVSTPSATPLTTSSPTQSSTPTSKATQSATLLPSPTPETGNLTPTFAVFIFGLSLLLSSIFIWNKSNVN